MKRIGVSFVSSCFPLLLVAGAVRAEPGASLRWESLDSGRVSPQSEIVAGSIQAKEGAAASKDGTAKSRAFFEKGLALARDKDFLGARKEFELALEDEPPLSAYYGMGQVELALGHPCQAAEAYSSYLRIGGERVPLEKRRQVERHLRQLQEGGAAAELCDSEKALALLELRCELAGVGARLNGEELPVTPGGQQKLSPGSYEVEFYDEAGAWPVVSLELEPGQTALLQCAPPSQEEGPASLTSTDAGEADHFNGAQKFALATTGVGLGFAVATISHFFWNQGRHDFWDEQHSLLQEEGGTEAQYDLHNDQGDSIERASGVTVGLAIAAGVLTGGGLTLFYLESRKKEKKEAASAPETSLSGSVGPQSFSLSFRGKW